MKKKYLLPLILLFSYNIVFSQYYYISHPSPGLNPGGLNTDDEVLSAPGWTTILSGGLLMGTTSAIQTLPFTFNFNGSAVTQYRVSNTGILTFDVANTSLISFVNTSLPSSQIPDKSFCIWGLQGTGADDRILTKTFGTAPNRQHWVAFSSYSYQGIWTYWAIVLTEGRGNVYFVEQRHQQTYSGLTVGIQINDTTAFQVRNSPNLETHAGTDITAIDNAYYEFIWGRQAQYDLALNHVAMDPFVNIGDGPFVIQGELTSLGSDSVYTYDLNYRLNGGPIETGTVSAGILSGDQVRFQHPTPWAPTVPGTYTLEVWSSHINGNPDAKPANDTAKTSFSLSAAIPNIIDDYIYTFPLPRVIADASDRLNAPMDLDFHPDLNKNELWVINYDNETSGGSTLTVSNPGKANQRNLWRRDQNAWHFMSLPTGIAFSNNGNFATSPGIFDANHNGSDPFTGPTLWSGDSSIYAQPSGGNGSHLDMLHESPTSLGIASESGNAFWVVDGYNKQVVRYDFVKDHGPGNDDHDDGRVRRVTDFTVRMINNEIPCHLVLDKSTHWLYIVDGGNKRVLRMDITSGTPGGMPSFGPFETLAEYTNLSNTTWEVVIDSGLIQPTGIELLGNRLLVSDHANGDIIIYDIGGATVKPLKRLHTGYPGITGIKIGPDGFIWYVNSLRDELVKLELAAVPISPNVSHHSFSLFPNPAREILFLQGHSTHSSIIRIVDLHGKVLLKQILPAFSGNTAIHIGALSSGMYMVEWDTAEAAEGTGVQKLVIR